MAKKRMVLYDDQILVDMEVIFGAIREADGEWQRVEKEMREYFDAMRNVIPEGA